MFAGGGEGGEVGFVEVAALAAGEGEAAGGFGGGEGRKRAARGEHAVGVVGHGEDRELITDTAGQAANE